MRKIDADSIVAGVIQLTYASIIGMSVAMWLLPDVRGALKPIFEGVFFFACELGSFRSWKSRYYNKTLREIHQAISTGAEGAANEFHRKGVISGGARSFGTYRFRARLNRTDSGTQPARQIERFLLLGDGVDVEAR